jgi:putative hydrolase of the HAD superfamily
LATNQDAYHTQYLKKSLRFSQIFDHVYTSSDIGAKKPDSAFFDFIVTDRLARRSLGEGGGLVPHQTLFFDDRPAHVQKAITYGFQAHQYTSLNHFTAIVNAYL